MKIWEVFHDGPCGTSPIAFYTTEAAAKRRKAKWDKEVGCKMDEAHITWHILRGALKKGAKK